ncbi:hypothetical protein BUALT_Bualt06G0084500 [Buddleja alternifolia]|uniref:KIB1-4 beta-propeller domain-containing protein n=1 Tax=Buddleja alternifolia TaxID=168488 RepID=A0AAV6XKN7_9LAMI|nr:hypothetical protein BUALT_Bualt06G0084500 [Buddleja alternifolia]
MEGNMRYFLKKNTLTNPGITCTKPDCIVIAINRDLRILAFARLGDEVWTNVLVSSRCFDDVDYYKANFYAIDCHGFLFVCEIDNERPKGTKIAPVPSRIHDMDQKYNVELSGNLLLVIHFRQDRLFDYANHASIDVVTSDSQHKVPSLSSSAKAPPALQFGSLEPAMVKVLLADKGTMNEENYIDKFEEDGEWIRVTRRRRQRHCIDELHPLFLKKSYSPTARKPNPMKVLKTPHVNFKKPSKRNHRTPVTLDDFFPKKFFESKVETVYTVTGGDEIQHSTSCWGMPLKTPTSSHVEKNQAKSVVVEYIPQLNPKRREIVADVHVQPGSTSKMQSKVTRSNDYQVMEKRLIMPIKRLLSPKVYKLLEKSGYNFSNPSGLGKLEPELTGEKIHEGDGKGKKPSDNRVSVFDRLSTPTARPSVFGRLGSSSRIPNVQDRLGASSISQSSIFNRLGGGSTQQLKKRNHAGETDMAGSRNNNQTLILPQPQGSKSSLGSYHHGWDRQVDEDSDPEASNDEIQEAPSQLEDGGQATVDELKELNLVTVPELVVSVTDEKMKIEALRSCQGEGISQRLALSSLSTTDVTKFFRSTRKIGLHDSSKPEKCSTKTEPISFQLETVDRSSIEIE